MSTLAFSISDSHGGFARSDGLLSTGDDQLLVEFQTSDSVAGVLKSGVKKLEIPFEAIAEVNWKRGFFGGRIRIGFKSMEWAAAFPRCRQNEVVFEIARRNRDRAGEFVRDLRFSLMSNDLDDMMETIDSVDPLRDA